MKKLVTIICSVTFVVTSCSQSSEGPNMDDNQSTTKKTELIPDAVKDIDGNSYNAVKIGEQIWMTENLRCKHTNDGKEIRYGKWADLTPYYEYPNRDSNNVAKYGYLYNCTAAMESCPTGWHLPTDKEWTQLLNYVSSQNQYICDGNKEHIAKALASKEGWRNSNEQGDVGNNPSSNNATGFSALPAGNAYDSFGSNAYFWSSEGGYYYYFGFYNADVVRNKQYANLPRFSVRCVKD